MTIEFPASTYPDSIFTQTTPDQTQSLDDSPTFNVLLKGYKTRSMMYERLLPDNTGGALRLQGPRGGNTAFIMDNNGSISTLGNNSASQFYVNMTGVAAYTSGINQAVFELHLINDGVRKPFNMKHGGELSGGAI